MPWKARKNRRERFLRNLFRLYIGIGKTEKLTVFHQNSPAASPSIPWLLLPWYPTGKRMKLFLCIFQFPSPGNQSAKNVEKNLIMDSWICLFPMCTWDSKCFFGEIFTLPAPYYFSMSIIAILVDSSPVPLILDNVNLLHPIHPNGAIPMVLLLPRLADRPCQRSSAGRFLVGSKQPNDGPI